MNRNRENRIYWNRGWTFFEEYTPALCEKETAGFPEGTEVELPHTSRHAWASIAKSKNISISVICEAMGHDSENTTKIYLASLDTSAVDKANSLIINSL